MENENSYKENLSKVEKEIANYKRLNHKMIIDFSSNDPQTFRPDKDNYWQIVSRRG